MRLALLALAVAAAYSASLFAAFQFDDWNVIVGNPAVHSWGALAAELGRGLRPLLKVVDTLNWTLGGGEPLAFHAFNILVHALNTCLIYLLGLELAARWRVQARGAILCAALVFALHPVQTEAVTYASGGSISLAAAFYLGALLAYLRLAPLWTSLALFLLACASRETALSLPAALLLCEVATREPLDWRAIARRQFAHWALAGVLLLMGAFAHERYARFLQAAFGQRSLADNLVSQVQGVGYLVSRLFLPHRLNIDPALPALSAWDAGLVLQAAALAALLACGLFQLRRRPWVGFGLCWFFVQLAPTNSVVPRVDVANERQLYLALWGLALAVCVQLALQRLQRLRATAAALLAPLAVLGVARQLEYRSEVALWEAAVREAPWNARAHNNLGYARMLAGDREGAMRDYREALVFDPGNETARFNLQEALAGGRRR
jgi:hypothetical protein